MFEQIFGQLDDQGPVPALADVWAIRRRTAELQRRRRWLIGAGAVVVGGVLVAGASVSFHSGQEVSTAATSTTTAAPSDVLNVSGGATRQIDATVTCTPAGNYLVTVTLSNAGGGAAFTMTAGHLVIPGAASEPLRLLTSGAADGALAHGESASATASVPGTTKAEIIVNTETDGAVQSGTHGALAGDCAAH